MEDFEGITLIATMIVTTISDWITAARLRRRIRQVFLRDVTELELTSLNLWMKVDEEEEKRRRGKMVRTQPAGSRLGPRFDRRLLGRVRHRLCRQGCGLCAGEIGCRRVVSDGEPSLIAERTRTGQVPADAF